jgi:hypothetical protein
MARAKRKMDFDDDDDGNEFHKRSRAAWDATVAKVSGPTAPATMVWRGREAIAKALTPFIGDNRNHAHFPSGGGLDFRSVAPSAEPGCLEFGTGEHVVQIMKPRSLTLERIDSAGNSFLLLELDDLDPSGVYEDDEKEQEGDKGSKRAEQASEELFEVAPGDYRSREIFDRGFLDHDENGDEIPIPNDARLAVRWFKGKVLLVAKGSLWNGDPATYDGRHNRMTADEIRHIIERSLSR